MTYWFCAVSFLDVLHYGNTSWNFPKHSIQHQWLCKFYPLLTRSAPVPREICHTQSLILWKSFRGVLSSSHSFQILLMRLLKMGCKYKHNWKFYCFLFFYPFTPGVKKHELLLTISIHHQEERWWEIKKLSARGMTAV